MLGEGGTCPLFSCLKSQCRIDRYAVLTLSGLDEQSLRHGEKTTRKKSGKTVSEEVQAKVIAEGQMPTAPGFGSRDRRLFFPP